MEQSLDSLPPAKDIPVAFTASLRSWWHAGQKQSAISEERLLRRLPFYRPPSSSPLSPSGPIIATTSQLTLRNPSHYLNTLTITPTDPAPISANAPPVLLHGYGAGLGFFFHNLPALGSWAAKRQTPVYALDWLGMGRSARPPFSIDAKKNDVKGRVEQAESFFIDSLEQWREKMGLGKMTLIGHSLGAYFSVAYALKYPDRVNKLILLSPAGVTRGPNWTDPSRELVDDGTSHPGKSVTFKQATKDKVNKIEQEQKAEKQQMSRTRRLLMYFWEEGWSPFQLVRSTLFWSPLLVGKYSSRRFPSLTPSETRDMHEYLLNLTLSKGSGEYCISHILAPGAWAHMPLVDRVAMLPKEMPVTFVYGDQDWMDPVGGFESVERLRLAGNPNGKMYIISDAGHHRTFLSYLLSADWLISVSSIPR